MRCPCTLPQSEKDGIHSGVLLPVGQEIRSERGASDNLQDGARRLVRGEQLETLRLYRGEISRSRETKRVPNSDCGRHAYSRHEFGDFAAYLVGWCYWIQSRAGKAPSSRHGSSTWTLRSTCTPPAQASTRPRTCARFRSSHAPEHPGGRRAAVSTQKGTFVPTGEGTTGPTGVVLVAVP
jgi:hypothetical protein